MPLPVPNLDDLSYDRLRAEAVTLIPRTFPPWTDHNASDPGITILELFAFLFDALGYQMNRIPDRNRARFAELIGEAVRKDPATGAPEPVDETLRRATARLAAVERAVTVADLERLAVEAPAAQRIGRARAVIQVEDVPDLFPAEETIRVAVVPDLPGPAPVPTSQTREDVFVHLQSRRLLTTRLQVVGPTYSDVDVHVAVVRDRRVRADAGALGAAVEAALRSFLSPLGGGPSGLGWEFGRSVYRSELYQAVEGVPGVDHVRALLLGGDESVAALPLSGPTALPRARSMTVVVEG